MPLGDIKIINRWTIEKNTVRYRIAEQCLILRGDDKKSKDYSIFDDNGDITLTCLFTEMCAANSKAIRKEEQERLKL